MRIATILVTLLLAIPRLWAASSAVNGEIFVAAGTSGTNALPSSRTTNVTINATSKAADGTTAYKLDTSLAHTSGNLFELKNNGNARVTVDYGGNTTFGVTTSTNDGVQIYTNAVSVIANSGANPYLRVYESVGGNESFFYPSYLTLRPAGVTTASLTPGANASTTPYILGSSASHTSGFLATIANNGTNAATLDYNGGLTLGRTASQGSLTLSDADGSNTHRRTPASAVTTDINEVGPAAPFQGVPAYDVSSTTNFTQRASVAADFRTASGVHATPTTTNPLSPTWTTPLEVVFYGATGTINLPAAASYAGAALLVYNTGAFTITIDPNGSEVVVRNGTVQTGGVSITLSSGAGNYVFLYCDGARWITLGFNGTLAQGS